MEYYRQVRIADIFIKGVLRELKRCVLPSQVDCIVRGIEQCLEKHCLTQELYAESGYFRTKLAILLELMELTRDRLCS